MADETEWRDWDRTAQLSAMIANTARDPKKRARPFSPAEFHPLLIARKGRQKAPISVLKDAFIDKKLPTHRTLKSKTPMTNDQ